MTFGSSTAYRGISGKSLMGYLCLVPLSTITAASVVSLPVPAVVGTAMSTGSFFHTRRMPFIWATVLSGRTSRHAAALAVSMGAPPPRPMKLSHPAAR